MMKPLRYLSLFAVFAMAISACSTHLGLSRLLGGGSPPVTKTARTAASLGAAGDSISIVKARFRPKNLTIKEGTTLTWTNNDTVAESVTSDSPGLFDSGPLAPGGKFSFTFSNVGSFPYHSSSSDSSFGSVTVTP